MTTSNRGMYYLNNRKLKRAGVQWQYNKWQMAEYIKCSKDCKYFIETYIKIINVDRGLINFNMFDYQREMVDIFNVNRFVIAKLPRQTGKSTIVTAYMLWLMLFNDFFKVAILANKAKLARDLLAKIKLAYENLPFWIQQGIVEWNKGSIQLENGSIILAESTSSSAARGESFNLVFLDEFAHVPNYLADDFFASTYPTISSGKTTKIFIVSTPKGMNHFYKMWTNAVEKKSNYTYFDIHWSQVPGRDAEWKEQEIANTSEEQFAQEQECEFVGSVNTLISSTKLRALAFVTPLQSLNYLDVYEIPIKDHTYTITVDTSRGVGIDYHAFIVVDVTTMPFKVVAVYRHNKTSPLVYPSIIYNVAHNYNDASVLVEINDNGEQTANILYHELEYDNVIMTTAKGRAGQQIGTGFGKRTQIGVRTTNQVKRLGCANLKDLVETDKLTFQDFNIIRELSCFVTHRGSYAAEEGQHDDLVMCLVLFAWMTRQSYFKELTNNDTRRKILLDHREQIESDVLPFGVIDDGRETDFIIGDDGTKWEVVDPIYAEDEWLHT